MILHYSHCIHLPVFRLTYHHFVRKKLKAYGVFVSSGNFYTELVYQRPSSSEGCQIYGRILYKYIHRLAWNNLLIKL